MFKRLFSARRWLALCGLVTVLILAFLAVISPQQLPVIAYKAGLVSFAACIGVWIDRAIFPYARPSGYLKKDWLRDPDADGGDDEVDFEIWPFKFVNVATPEKDASVSWRFKPR